MVKELGYDGVMTNARKWFGSIVYEPLSPEMPFAMILKHEDGAIEWLKGDDAEIVEEAMYEDDIAALLIAESKGFEQVEAIGLWGKYKVWQPSYTDEPQPLTGYPMVILEDELGDMNWNDDLSIDVFEVLENLKPLPEDAWID